jgi:transposase
VPKPFPPEFRRDVIAVARMGEASISQVARDFGISESCLQRWLKIADRDDGLAPPAAGDRGSGGPKEESAELGELRRRNNLLEQENEILLRATAHTCQPSRGEFAGRLGLAPDRLRVHYRVR